ncbi:MAG: DUF5615 family PIN-like protein [Parcubacteria group bacterium]|nr:DUF5615 family PIN-like protein [Parcubacteria group bacterium]
MPNVQLLLNENIGVKTAKFLRDKGYDIKSTIEDFRGVDDKTLMKIADKDKRIIVTLDRDFCQLVFRDTLPCRGIVLLRLNNELPESINKVLDLFLKNNKQDLNNKFVVVSENRVRIRRIK